MSYGQRLRSWVGTPYFIAVVPAAIIGGGINLISGVDHPVRLGLSLLVVCAGALFLPPIFVGKSAEQRVVANASKIVWREFFRQRRRLWLSAAASGALIGVAVGLAGPTAGPAVGVLGLLAGYLAFKTGLALPPPAGGEQRA